MRNGWHGWWNLGDIGCDCGTSSVVKVIYHQDSRLVVWQWIYRRFLDGTTVTDCRLNNWEDQPQLLRLPIETAEAVHLSPSKGDADVCASTGLCCSMGLQAIAPRHDHNRKPSQRTITSFIEHHTWVDGPSAKMYTYIVAALDGKVRKCCCQALLSTPAHQESSETSQGSIADWQEKPLANFYTGDRGGSNCKRSVERDSYLIYISYQTHALHITQCVFSKLNISHIYMYIHEYKHPSTQKTHIITCIQPTYYSTCLCIYMWLYRRDYHLS